MIKVIFKNRTLIQLFLVSFFLLLTYNLTNSIADNVEINSIENNQNIQNLKIVNVNIPQGSSASEISSILDTNDFVFSSECFELKYERTLFLKFLALPIYITLPDLSKNL